jgi:hypothetical protein
MNSTEMFRSHALATEQRVIDWWWGIVAMLCIATVYGVVGELDARSKTLESAQAVEQRVRNEMKHTVVAAYRQGRSDTLEAVGCQHGAEVRP